ncbi:MAG: CHAT domain-containing protein [Methanosarcinaceae archaeon]|nr:CHAT domain-containing protein [Methanosarcinaceae archaeon]
MRRVIFLCIFIIMISSSTSTASGQFFATCQCGSRAELEASIKSHNEHIYRLERKFTDIFYFQGPVPLEKLKTDLTAVLCYLRKLPRRAAVVFYGYQPNRLCTWLISPHLRSADFVSHAADFDDREIVQLYEEFRNSIGVSNNDPERSKNTAPQGNSSSSALEKTSPSRAYNEILGQLSQILLPKPISDELIEAKIDTLVIVPITMKYYVEGINAMNDAPDESAHIASIGSIPFSALRLRDKMLVDLMSVVVAPGFYVFSQDPLRISRPSGFRNPLIVGDPINPKSGWIFKELPGARVEAENIAKDLGTTAIIGPKATRENVIPKVQPSTDLIYLATHGFADARNPRDSSFLVLSNGLWRACEIQSLKLEARPLVVLSACQTALGKDFDVGTIGLARSWQWAGASNVVMSFWNIYDEFAGEFMPIFMQLAKHLPPEEALRRAMVQIRSQDKYNNPKYWAGFAVYGAPHIIN